MSIPTPITAGTVTSALEAWTYGEDDDVHRETPERRNLIYSELGKFSLDGNTRTCLDPDSFQHSHSNTFS